MAIQKAFITDAAFTVEDHGFAAVVTAKASDVDTSKLEITCDILGYVEPISITLDQDDFKAMRELLGFPDPGVFYDAAKAAFAALDEIAALDLSADDAAEWAVARAKEALSRINGEADDGTTDHS